MLVGVFHKYGHSMLAHLSCIPNCCCTANLRNVARTCLVEYTFWGTRVPDIAGNYSVRYPGTGYLPEYIPYQAMFAYLTPHVLSGVQISLLLPLLPPVLFSAPCLLREFSPRFLCIVSALSPHFLRACSALSPRLRRACSAYVALLLLFAVHPLVVLDVSAHRGGLSSSAAGLSILVRRRY